MVPTVPSGRVRPRRGHVEVPRRSDAELSVHRVGPVVVVREKAPVALQEGTSDARPVAELAGQTHDGIGLLTLHAFHLVGADVEQAHVQSPDLAREPPAALDGDTVAVARDADPSAEEQAGAASADREHARVLKEERPLFGELDAEPREVGLNVVHLDLREVRVIGEIERQSLRDLNLGVAADLAVLAEARLTDRVVAG